MAGATANLQPLPPPGPPTDQTPGGPREGEEQTPRVRAPDITGPEAPVDTNGPEVPEGGVDGTHSTGGVPGGNPDQTPPAGNRPTMQGPDQTPTTEDARGSPPTGPRTTPGRARGGTSPATQPAAGHGQTLHNRRVRCHIAEPHRIEAGKRESGPFQHPAAAHPKESTGTAAALDGGRSAGPGCRYRYHAPMCDTNNQGPYVDLRVDRALVFFYHVHSQCNAGLYTSVLNGLQDRTAACRYQDRTGDMIVWSADKPTRSYWDHAKDLPETTITITSTPGPHGRWVDIQDTAQSADKYHVRWKHHKCLGTRGITDTYIHDHGRAEVRPEVHDAMRVLLAELYANDKPEDKCPDAADGPVRLHPMPVAIGPRTYLEPRLEPGLHFHRLPDLATIKGYILAMDAGTPDANSRKEARGAEFVDDPKGMAATIIQDVGGAVIAHTVMRGPGRRRKERRTP